MKKNIMNYVAILLLILVSINPTVFASDNNDFLISRDQLIDINPENIPDGVIPAEFNTETEALEYINQLVINSETINPEIIFPDKEPRATNRTIVVSEEQVGPGAKISLKANYGTSGSASTGVITYITPYTTFTGLQAGFTWDEKTLGYSIASNQKDAYIYTSGQLNYYVMINGLPKYYAREINLGRTCNLVR